MGINTEWGLLMASISEDTGEETPLQVFFYPIFNIIMKLLSQFLLIFMDWT